VVARVTPPLRINLSQGYVNVANDSYSLADMSTVYDGDLQYDGIEPEAAVVAVGTLLPADGALQIEAEFIALGSQTSYVESLRREALIWYIIGTIFGLIGVGLLAAAVVVAIKA
jgi:spore maturation protein SpmB